MIQQLPQQPKNAQSKPSVKVLSVSPVECEELFPHRGFETCIYSEEFFPPRDCDHVFA